MGSEGRNIFVTGGIGFIGAHRLAQGCDAPLLGLGCALRPANTSQWSAVDPKVQSGIGGSDCHVVPGSGVTQHPFPPPSFGPYACRVAHRALPAGARLHGDHHRQPGQCFRGSLEVSCLGVLTHPRTLENSYWAAPNVSVDWRMSICACRLRPVLTPTSMELPLG